MDIVTKAETQISRYRYSFRLVPKEQASRENGTEKTLWEDKRKKPREEPKRTGKNREITRNF